MDVEPFARRVMSGRERGPSAALLRAGLATAEPLYAAAVIARNWLFDKAIRTAHRLPHPVVSVGNITTGGTGKTPVVRWIASRLRDTGRHVAVLARGYGARPGELGDEQLMLQSLLSADVGTEVLVRANPDRVGAARLLLREHPETEVFVADDGFQHRRLARDLDIVLVSATSPFGYDHLLPRGMLREPLGGLRRASAVVITHADQVPARGLDEIERRIRAVHPLVPVYRASHEHAALRTPADPAPQSLESLCGRSWFAVCGIGDPQTFLRQLQSIGGRCAGYRWFGDHHKYEASDLADVRREARAAAADVLVTTEKDWAKLKHLPAAADTDLPVWRVDMRVRFLDDGEERLWEQVSGVISAKRNS